MPGPRDAEQSVLLDVEAVGVGVVRVKSPVDKTFRRYDQDQPMLLPPDIRDWLPADHPAVLAGELDVVRRRSASTSWLFAINHSSTEVALPVSGWDLLGGSAVTGTLRLSGGGWAVVREA